jgi:hypothetical protein
LNYLSARPHVIIRKPRLVAPRHRRQALSVAVQGKDEPPLDDPAKAKLRQQVADWLRTKLTAWDKLLAFGAKFHQVEVTGSNPLPPNDLRQIAGSSSAFGLPELPLSECYGYAVDVTSS